LPIADRGFSNGVFRYGPIGNRQSQIGNGMAQRLGAPTSFRCAPIGNWQSAIGNQGVDMSARKANNLQRSPFDRFNLSRRQHDK
jgi:hypothetical protein